MPLLSPRTPMQLAPCMHLPLRARPLVTESTKPQAAVMVPVALMLRPLNIVFFVPKLVVSPCSVYGPVGFCGAVGPPWSSGPAAPGCASGVNSASATNAAPIRRPAASCSLWLMALLLLFQTDESLALRHCARLVQLDTRLHAAVRTVTPLLLQPVAMAIDQLVVDWHVQRAALRLAEVPGAVVAVFVVARPAVRIPTLEERV